MRLFQAALDTALDSPILRHTLSSRFALHGLRAVETTGARGPPQSQKENALWIWAEILASHQSIPRVAPRIAPSMGLRMALGQKSLQNESSPEFFKIFVPNFAPKLLRIFPEFFEEFSFFVSWETETK